MNGDDFYEQYGIGVCKCGNEYNSEADYQCEECNKRDWYKIREKLRGDNMTIINERLLIDALTRIDKKVNNAMVSESNEVFNFWNNLLGKLQTLYKTGCSNTVKERDFLFYSLHCNKMEKVRE